MGQQHLAAFLQKCVRCRWAQIFKNLQDSFSQAFFVLSQVRTSGTTRSCRCPSSTCFLARVAIRAFLLIPFLLIRSRSRLRRLGEALPYMQWLLHAQPTPASPCSLIPLPACSATVQVTAPCGDDWTGKARSSFIRGQGKKRMQGQSCCVARAFESQQFGTQTV